MGLAVNVYAVGKRIRAFLTSITLMPQRSFVQNTAIIPRQYVLLSGSAKRAISKCYVQTAIASRLGKIASDSIACRRIEQAYAQPDMFVAPPPKATQESLL